MKLYQYKGGGYDGCIWEWNFFLLDGDKFIDVVSSGYNGITDSEKAHELAKGLNSPGGRSSTYMYDLDSEESIKEFCSENNPTNVGRVCKRVNSLLDAAVMFYECTYCGERVYHCDDVPVLFDEDNYHGDGGIGIVFEAVLCEACYCNRCDDCDSIIGGPGEEDAVVTDDFQLCSYCAEDRKAIEDEDEDEDDEAATC